MRVKLAIIIAVFVALAGISVGAIPWVGHAYALPCERHLVFARDINAIPQNTFYYRASDCETVLADHAFVVLPPLENATKPVRVVVRNVGNVNLYVGSGDSLIDPTVSGYTGAYPQLPIYAGGNGAVRLEPGQAGTFIAMPNKLAHAWFTE